MNKINTAISRKTAGAAGFFVKGIFISLLTVIGFCIHTNAQVTLTATAGIPAGSYTNLIVTLSAPFSCITPKPTPGSPDTTILSVVGCIRMEV